MAVFWDAEASPRPKAGGVKGQLARGVVRILVVLLPMCFTYWIADHNNRSPTPIDGTWEVSEVAGELDGTDLPTRIYFEHNRAYQSVFRYPSSVTLHHFEVQPEEGRLDLWETWLQRGGKLFTGSYELHGDTLAVEGLFEREGAFARLRLTRVR